MKQQAFLLIISIVLLSSCQREQDWDGAPDIKAKVESEQKTRTSLSVDESGSGTIYWNPSDKIDVFFGTKKTQYTSQNASDAIAATFKTSDSVSGTDVSSTNIWGLYPSNSSSSCNGSSITTTLPSTQYGVPNTFDKDIFPAVARSSSTDLQFYNVCGGIKFNLAYDDIKKITFRGNNNEDLAGTVSISFVDNLPKATIVNGVKEITLTPKTGTTFTKGADYYFILLPVTLSAGFTITFTTTDGTTGTLNYTDNPVTIKRSIFGKKGNMDVYAAFADERQPNNVIYYTSTDGKIVTPSAMDVFGANIVSNEYVVGRGIITFDGGISSFGSFAFDGCGGLTSVVLPNSISSIGTYAFNNCTSLTSVAIPNSVTSIGNFAFDGCKRLSSIDLPNSVTSIGDYSFALCEGLTSIEIPNSVANIGLDAFIGCTSLASVSVQSGNQYYDSRNNCNAIIEGSTLILGIKNTIIPNSVSCIGYRAFFGCTGLTCILIPNSVTSIEYSAFSGCTSLTSIEIPKSVTNIGDLAFRGCIGLTSIVVDVINPPVLGTFAFDSTNNCPIYVLSGSVEAYKTADGWSEYADRIQAIPDTHEAVDLGLPSGVKWATCNVGASSPEEYGDYFAWGETEAKTDYSWFTYRWCNGSETTLTKYNTKSNYGTVDNKTVLDLSDDAARANWGGSWRMPTDAEWTELRTQCVWTWTTLGGKNGYNVRGPNGNTIFLPAAGRRNGTSLDVAGSYGFYWSSSLDTDYPRRALYVFFYSSDVYGDYYYRYNGLSVRPVLGDFISVESISLNKSSLSITEGETSQLSATVMPANATEKTVTWTSSNTSVATVSSAGVVTAVSAGTATITAWASDDEHFATCTVTVTQPHEAVDLGLSVKWATCNVGASSPEERGDFFAWGETSPKTEYTWDNYKFTESGDSWSNATLSKYNTSELSGVVDNRTELEPDDDAAHINWGGGWRMPTSSEAWELIDNCSWMEITQNGVFGIKITGKNGNSIFLPASDSSNCFYWCSTLSPRWESKDAYDLYHYRGSSTLGASNYTRFVGLPVRPVRE